MGKRDILQAVKAAQSLSCRLEWMQLLQKKAFLLLLQKKSAEKSLPQNGAVQKKKKTPKDTKDHSFEREAKGVWEKEDSCYIMRFIL